MIKIIADSTCDLEKEQLERFDIRIVPLHVLLGEQEYEDGINITPQEIYKWSDANQTTPKTSAPSMERCMEVLEKALEGGNQVICFSISGQMSTSGNVMRLAADELSASDRVYVIDSQSLSTGIGLLVLQAAQMAQDGKTAEEIVETVTALIPKVRASFVVDTLVYLHRGGRCGGLAAMLGGAIRLHPTIVVEDGKMHSAKKYRGNISRVVKAYAKDLEEDLLHARKEMVFITHSGCDAETVQPVREYLEGLQHFDEILETHAGGVISSHCGPGTLGVLFIDGE